MIQLAFAILTVAGSWYAWRRNPMYSRRRTLHFLLATVLSVAAVVGLVLAVLHFTENRSKEFQITALLIAIAIATVGLIWILITITTPKPTPLPEGVKMATLHRRRLIPWVKRMAWTLAVCGVLALVPSSAGTFDWVQFFALFIGAWVLGLGSIMLAAGYIGGRNLDRALTSVLANPWVHWTYTPEEWNALTDRLVAEAAADKPKEIKKWMVFPIIALPVAVGMYLTDLLPIWADLLIGVGFAGLIMGILVLSERAQSNSPRRLAARLQAAPHEVLLGPDGIFANGRYNPWLTAGIYLTAASLSQKPPTAILFQFEQINAGRTATTTHFSETVLLPSGLDSNEIKAQLALLQQRLGTLVRSARVYIG